jgi:hypothetical protein
LSNGYIFCPHKEIPALTDGSPRSAQFNESLKHGKFQFISELTAAQLADQIETNDILGITLQKFFDERKLEPSTVTSVPHPSTHPDLSLFATAKTPEVAAFIHPPWLSTPKAAMESHLERIGLPLDEVRYEHLDYLFDMEETMTLTDLTNASLRKFFDGRTHPTKRLYIQDLYLFQKYIDASAIRELIDLITEPYQSLLKEVVILSSAAMKTEPRGLVPAIVARYKSIGKTLRDSGYPIRFYHAKPEFRAEIHDRRIFTDNYAVKIENSISQSKSAQTSTIPTWVGRFAPKSLTWSEMNEHWLSFIEPSNCIEIK